MKNTLALFGLLLSGLVMNTAYAATAAEVKEALGKVSPRLAGATVEPTQVKNVFRFWSGAELNFVYYADGHALIGDMLDLDRRVSLGEEAKGQRVVGLLDGAAGQSIDYGPSSPKRVLNVFTDIDCGYCRKLHNEMDQLTQAGIQVKYFAFPRAGVNSPSFRKYVSVWCADDRQAAMTAAKAGMQPVSKSCENPIADTHKLGKEIGLRGTPMLVYDDGTIVNGYKPAATLIKELGL